MKTLSLLSFRNSELVKELYDFYTSLKLRFHALKALLLLGLSFESSRDSDVCTPTESSHAHKGVISPKLSCSFDLQGNSSFFLSPSNGELGYPPGYPSLKQPLVETFRVFNNPVKVLLLGLFFQNTELNRFLFLCLSAHYLNALLAELYRTHSRVLMCIPCTGSMPTWKSFTYLLRDSICNCVLLHSLSF
jgi:hypothetical protein